MCKQLPVLTILKEQLAVPSLESLGGLTTRLYLVTGFEGEERYSGDIYRAFGARNLTSQHTSNLKSQGHLYGVVSNMKVGMYSDTIFPSPDGVAVSIEALCRGLQKLGVSVEVVAPRQCCSGAIPTRFITSFCPPGRDYHVGLTMPWLHSSRTSADDYDIVHVHTLGPVGLAGLTAAHLAKVPVILTWHTDLITYRDYYPEVKFGTPLVNITAKLLSASPNGGMISFRPTTAMRHLLSVFDGIVAPTPKVYHQLRHFGVRQYMVIIPSPTLPLEVPESSPEQVRHNLDIAAKAEVVLSVGRLSKEKNLDLLLRAFSDLRRRRPSVQLVLVGPTRGRRQLLGLAHALDITSSIHVPGPVDRDLLGAYYRMADVFVLPSLSETQSLVALEAEAFDLPVVVVDGALKRSFGGSCRALAEPSPSPLAKQINACLDDAKHRRSVQYPQEDCYQPAIADQSKKLVEMYSCAIKSSASRRVASRAVGQNSPSAEAQE